MTRVLQNREQGKECKTGVTSYHMTALFCDVPCDYVVRAMSCKLTRIIVLPDDDTRNSVETLRSNVRVNCNKRSSALTS